MVRAFDIAHVLASALTAAASITTIANDGEGEMVLLCTLVAAAGAAISSLACRWWPGLVAPGWRLWLAAWLFNPVVSLALIYILSQSDCLLGQTRGWGCMAVALVVLASPVTLIAPAIAVIAHAIARKAGPPAAS